MNIMQSDKYIVHNKLDMFLNKYKYKQLPSQVF